MLTSCQKDNSMAPDNSFSESLAVQNSVEKVKPKPSDLPMIDPISNYPDPFTETTTIQFRVDTGTKVSLIVYNELGEKMAILVGQYLPAGEYRTVYNATHCPCGKYRAVLQTGNIEAVENMTKVYSTEAELPGWE
ncbi:MAG: hypothetical protein P8100_00720 [bacterium]